MWKHQLVPRTEASVHRRTFYWLGYIFFMLQCVCVCPQSAAKSNLYIHLFLGTLSLWNQKRRPGFSFPLAHEIFPFKLKSHSEKLTSIAAIRLQMTQNAPLSVEADVPATFKQNVWWLVSSLNKMSFTSLEVISKRRPVQTVMTPSQH